MLRVGKAFDARWRVRTVGLAVIALVVAGLMPLPRAHAQASTLTVCATGCDHTELADAVAASSGGDVIEILPGSYPNTSVTVSHDLFLIGDAGAPPILDASGSGVVLTVDSGAAVWASDVVVTGGSNDGQGGGIVVDGATLDLVGVVVEGNTSVREGAGIFATNGATVSLVDSTVRANVVSRNKRGGGGIAVDGATVSVHSSTVSGNTAGGGGGGIYAMSGDVTVVNSTVSGNEAKGSDGGGGILNDGGTLSLDFVTITENLGKNAAAGIRNRNGEVTIHGTVVAGNQSTSDKDCQGGFQSIGYNIVGSAGLGCPGFGETDLVAPPGQAIDPLLGALGDNGGPTETHFPLPGSPAIDFVPTSGAGCPAFDQRGIGRPAPP